MTVQQIELERTMKTFRPSKENEKNPLVWESVYAAEKILQSFRWDKPNRCLNHAFVLQCELKRRGFKQSMIQAGTCYWPRTDDWMNPIGDQSFGWEWDSENWHIKASKRVFPEMHVWTVVPELKLICDMSVKHFPEVCKTEKRLDWQSWFPESGYAVIDVHHSVPGVMYRPYAEATIFSHLIACDIVNKMYMCGTDIDDLFPGYDPNIHIPFHLIGTKKCPVKLCLDGVKEVQL